MTYVQDFQHFQCYIKQKQSFNRTEKGTFSRMYRHPSSFLPELNYEVRKLSVKDPFQAKTVIHNMLWRTAVWRVSAWCSQQDPAFVTEVVILTPSYLFLVFPDVLLCLLHYFWTLIFRTKRVFLNLLSKCCRSLFHLADVLTVSNIQKWPVLVCVFYICLHWHIYW